MSTGGVIACITLGIACWPTPGARRFSSTIGEAVKTLNEKAARLEEKAKLADEVPSCAVARGHGADDQLQQRNDQNRSIRPELVRVGEHIKAWINACRASRACQHARPRFGSRPDPDE